MAPTVTSVTIGWDQFTHVATGTATFTDPGTQDTHTASFVWTVNSVALPAVAGTVSESSGSGSASNSLILGPGCYTLRADVTVADDDTGSGTNFGSGTALTHTTSNSGRRSRMTCAISPRLEARFRSRS